MNKSCQESSSNTCRLLWLTVRLGFGRTLIFFFFFFFFLELGVFEMGLTLVRQALYNLSHSANPFFGWVFFQIGSHELLPGLALNHDLPDLPPE
jgi:hypothetical protein